MTGRGSVIGGALVALLLAACAGREPVPGPPDPASPSPLAEEDLRVLAMRQLQNALASEMRLWVQEGRFTDQVSELDAPQAFDPGPGAPPEARVSIEACEDDTVVVLATATGEGSVLAVKARGLEPHGDGEAVFGHYTEEPPCDPSEGPETWPGGWHVSRQGLQREEG